MFVESLEKFGVVFAGYQLQDLMVSNMSNSE